MEYNLECTFHKVRETDYRIRQHLASQKPLFSLINWSALCHLPFCWQININTLLAFLKQPYLVSGLTEYIEVMAV